MKTFESYLHDIGEYGIVEQSRYPLAVVSGLPNVKIEELVVFEGGYVGQVFMIGRDFIEVLVLGRQDIKAGTRVARTDEFFTVPVGQELLGSIIDPFGNSLSGKLPASSLANHRIVDTAPAGIDTRAKIKKPFHTGVMVVDTMIPLGYGQKELVIGDRKTGKTAFLQTAIKYQVKTHDTIAIYCGIGKKKSDVKKIEEFFQNEGLVKNTVIVATSSNDSPSLIFMTPYSAMTIAEYFRDQGRDVLIILDDLSTHAKFYREISLLAKRFPGRDSYPGDIFYVHSRLLERTGNFKVEMENHTKTDIAPEKKLKKSHGNIQTNSQTFETNRFVEASITALPVVEIVEGDLTGYVSSNIMSMTDGHIFFDSDIYYKGRRPAINIALSVTRVGKQVHSDVLRSINRELSTLFVLYEKTQNLSHFGAELSDSVLHVLQTGEIFYKFFTQGYSVPVPVEVLLASIAIIWLKYYDENNTDCIFEYRKSLLDAYSKGQYRQFFDSLPASVNFNDLLLKVSSQRDIVNEICRKPADKEGAAIQDK